MAQKRCDLIELELAAELHSGRYRPHDKFYSEKQLSARFACNDATARKAIDRLVGTGLLYKKPSSGTFVAPARKNKLILLVMPGREDTLLRYCYSPELLNSNYRFNEIPETEFLHAVRDIELLFPDICGVLFFRDPRYIRESFPILRQKKIAFAFYGSSVHQATFANIPALFYSEKELTELALDHLWAQGCRQIGCIYGGSWAATQERYRFYLLWLQKKRRQPNPELLIDNDIRLHPYEAVDDLADFLIHHRRKMDGFFCTDDSSAALLLQAAARLNIPIPDEFKVIGVNNFPICELVPPGISSIDIPIAEDCPRLLQALIAAIEQRPHALHQNSEIHLIRRGSA